MVNRGGGGREAEPQATRALWPDPRPHTNKNQKAPATRTGFWHKVQCPSQAPPLTLSRLWDPMLSWQLLLRAVLGEEAARGTRTCLAHGRGRQGGSYHVTSITQQVPVHRAPHARVKRKREKKASVSPVSNHVQFIGHA